MSNNTSPSQSKPQAQADEKPFAQELKDWIQEQQEGALIRLTGEIRSSVGSGAMYVLANTLELAQ